jgi:hypothetical protein
VSVRGTHITRRTDVAEPLWFGTYAIGEVRGNVLVESFDPTVAAGALVARTAWTDQAGAMRLQRHVVVLDAADIEAVSTFWARMLGGRVYADETFHCVLDSDGRWLLGVQLAADHEAPGWPDGNAQQIHLDLHVEDPNEAHREAMNCGARLLQEADDLDAEEGFQVYAEPAGHPFCIGWGHPSDETIRRQFASLPDPSTPES